MINIKNNSYQVKFAYDPAILNVFKTLIPASGRNWDANQKYWQVDTQYEGVLRQIFPNENIPTFSQAARTETRVIELRYLGQVKHRGTDDYSAFGYAQKTWSVIFPEKVLRQWFEGFVIEQPGMRATETFYTILGVQKAASEEDVKTAYRRMARQWHPDVCKENNATEVFMRIKSVYEVLGNPQKRARYDAGLALEASIVAMPKDKPYDEGVYRAPLRCGMLICEGMERVGRFVVSKISLWEDIIDANGRILVVSWPIGSDKPVEVWS